MLTIWKFPLAMADQQTFVAPPPFTVLHVDVQRFGDEIRLCIWAIVDDDLDRETHVVEIYRTGGRLADPDRREYLGTVPVGDCVWHVFEVFDFSGS